jgi:hypothetical protein
MNARLERKLRLFAIVVAASVIGAVVYSLAQGFTTATGVAVGISYGLLISVAMTGISLFVLEGPMRAWIGGLSFTASLIVRSAIYAAIIIPILYFRVGDVLAGVPRDLFHQTFWIDIIYSVVFLVLANLVIGIANIIGPRAFLNFITGRYHSPVEENRFVLFVDIAGSTGLAERIGGYRLSEQRFKKEPLAFCCSKPRGGSPQFHHAGYLAWLEDRMENQLHVIRKVSLRGGTARNPFQAELAVLRTMGIVNQGYRIGIGLSINWPELQDAMSFAETSYVQ